ncbi:MULTISPECIES: hypothetical protein [unclassified Mesorhizobium]|uniref:hypothetical protein n=1 Tax=unclassified Mesorhizobium TaxID=325217 RepID=UPI001AECDAD8|nr:MULTISPECIES: hypothetical protein [unclassified Mesorhizobium]
MSVTTTQSFAPATAANGKSTIFTNGQKKPMISTALFFDRLRDGISKNEKYYSSEKQRLMAAVNNRVGCFEAGEIELTA